MKEWRAAGSWPVNSPVLKTNAFQKFRTRIDQRTLIKCIYSQQAEAKYVFESDGRGRMPRLW